MDGGAGHQGRLSPSSLDGSQGAKISSSKATYIIDKLLGEGGFGAVYKVSDPTGIYALKVEGANEQIQVCLQEARPKRAAGAQNGGVRADGVGQAWRSPLLQDRGQGPLRLLQLRRHDVRGQIAPGTPTVSQAM